MTAVAFHVGDRVRHLRSGEKGTILLIGYGVITVKLDDTRRVTVWSAEANNQLTLVFSEGDRVRIDNSTITATVIASIGGQAVRVAIDGKRAGDTDTITASSLHKLVAEPENTAWVPGIGDRVEVVSELEVQSGFGEVVKLHPTSVTIQIDRGARVTVPYTKLVRPKAVEPGDAVVLAVVGGARMLVSSVSNDWIAVLYTDKQGTIIRDSFRPDLLVLSKKGKP